MPAGGGRVEQAVVRQEGRCGDRRVVPQQPQDDPLGPVAVGPAMRSPNSLTTERPTRNVGNEPTLPISSGASGRPWRWRIAATYGAQKAASSRQAAYASGVSKAGTGGGSGGMPSDRTTRTSRLGLPREIRSWTGGSAAILAAPGCGQDGRAPTHVVTGCYRELSGGAPGSGRDGRAPSGGQRQGGALRYGAMVGRRTGSASQRR